MSCKNPDCRICAISKRHEKVVASKDFNLALKFAEDMMNDVCCAEEDASYYKAILDGWWPQSVCILRRSLNKALGRDSDHLEELAMENSHLRDIAYRAIYKLFPNLTGRTHGNKAKQLYDFLEEAGYYAKVPRN